MTLMGLFLCNSIRSRPTEKIGVSRFSSWSTKQHRRYLGKEFWGWDTALDPKPSLMHRQFKKGCRLHL